MAVDQTARDVLIWQSFLTILHLSAILSTFFRLYRHRRIAQLWWDDYFAAVALAFDFIFFPALWLPLLPMQGDTKVVKQHVIVIQIVESWILSTTFVPVLWFSRISFALSTARFMLPKSLLYNACIGLASLFFAILVAVLASINIRCVKTLSTWTKKYPFQCGTTRAVLIMMICFDLVADASLIAIPVLAFWSRLKVSQTSRRLIQACFAASSLTAASNIIFMPLSSRIDPSLHATTNTALLARFNPHLLGPLSLLVCNLLVVVTSLYRCFRAERIPPSTISLSTSAGSSSHSDRRGTSCFASRPDRFRRSDLDANMEGREADSNG